MLQYEFKTERAAEAALAAFEARQTEARLPAASASSPDLAALALRTQGPPAPLSASLDGRQRAAPLQGPPPGLPAAAQPRGGVEGQARSWEPPGFASGLLQPQPVGLGPPKASASTPARASSALLADFEGSSAAASPFDALEIYSIDDRALLRQVLG